MDSHVSSVLVCVLCAALLPSVWAEFVSIHFIRNILLDLHNSQRQYSGRPLTSVVPAPVTHTACSALGLLVFVFPGKSVFHVFS